MKPWKPAGAGMGTSMSNRWFGAALAVLMVWMCPTVFGAVPARAGDKAADRAGLIESIKERGGVRVIVRLDVPNVGTLTRASTKHKGISPGRTASIEAREADAVLLSSITAATDHLLARMPVGNVSVTARFNYLPLIGLFVDGDGLRALEALPEVLSVVEDMPVRVPDTRSETGPSAPRDTTYNALIGADQAWSQGYTGRGWYVAVLDTGIRSTHEMFAGKTIVEHCFSTNNDGWGSYSACPNGQEEQDGPGSAGIVDSRFDHGTHVAGIATGKAETEKGVAIEANIVFVQVFSWFPDYGELLSWYSDQLKGLEWVYGRRHDYPIASANMSLGGGSYSAYCEGDIREEAIDLLTAAGIAVTISTGNDAYCASLSAPACVESAVAVGGSDTNDNMYRYSNWLAGGHVDLLAPGVRVKSAGADNDASYRFKNGTSMAAPHVAGAWAILKQKRPDAGVSELLAALQSTARPVNIEAYYCTGAGTVDRRIQIDAALIDLNRPPAAGAGNDQTVVEGATITLNGAGSSDPDPGDSLAYAWVQTGGSPAVILSDPAAIAPTFVCALDPGAASATLDFRLTVQDPAGAQAADDVSVTVNSNQITGFPPGTVATTTSTGKSVGVQPGAGDLVALASVDPNDLPAGSDKPAYLPFGLIRMDVKTPTPGATIDVTVYLSSVAPVGMGWIMYSPALGWYDFSDHAVFSLDRRSVVLTLTDGGPGDHDGLADGIIHDPSGPGSLPGTVAAGSPPQPAGGEGGCFLSHTDVP